MPALVCVVLLLASACAGVRGSEQASAAGGKPPAADELRLVISRDYGARVLKDILVPARADMTVMRLLAEHCDVSTKYGGGFVAGIDGLESSQTIGSRDAADWFFWVDGAMGTVGASSATISGGQTIWWDYHLWSETMFIPAALSAFPAPFRATGLALVMEASAGAGEMSAAVLRWAGQQSVRVRRLPHSFPAGADLGPLLIAGTPDRLMKDSLVGSALARGTAAGVFVAIEGRTLYALRADGERATRLTAAALALPDPNHVGRLHLVLIAQSASALRRLLDGVTPATASAHVALGLTSAGVVALPLATGGER